MKTHEIKRKFLIVTQNKPVFEGISQIIEKNFSSSMCLHAKDGSEAISKIQNDAPNVVISETQLAKMDGIKLTDWILKSKFKDKVSILLLSAIPDNEHFVDEIVTSQVQFVDPNSGEIGLTKGITKGLNFVSHAIPQEFYIKFLAAGDRLIKEGDKADNVYLVKRGKLSAKIQRGNIEVTLGTITSGEFVGEMAYINGETRSADVYAESECELIEIPVDVLDQVLFTKPSWSKALMKTLSKRVKVANTTRDSEEAS